eukprot:gnl/MRDRNA2_/MRDRNA2_78757_c0_seq1.p1 gnl/MRDRNA2_/MRDRNA2_78757_c0~~gnl/MRDRNA2_/MRDRNA2_78757_c0_seq1.p1  ORF type:complete len:682 (-),score=124.99 gnl/MRDRNA2_/MRDRNA2_78757_c0_seq1:163-2208(-)
MDRSTSPSGQAQSAVEKVKNALRIAVQPTSVQGSPSYETKASFPSAHGSPHLKHHTTWAAVRFPRLAAFIKGNVFESIMGIVIVYNCCSIGIEVHLCPPSDSPRHIPSQGDPMTHHECPGVFFAVTEHLCTFVFVFEFTTHFLIYGWRYCFLTRNGALDTFLCWICGVLLTWIFPLCGLAGGGNLRSLTVLRTLRLLRLLRVVRRHPAFKPIWTLFQGFLRSLEDLVPTCLVLTTFMYMFGILGCVLIGDASTGTFESADAEVQTFFQGIDMTMFTLLQIVTGDAWSSGIARPVLRYLPHLWIFFVGYIYLGMLVLLNLIAAVVVMGSLNAQKEDDEERLASMHEDRAEEIRNLRSLFDEMDLDGTGMITEAEFSAACKSDDVIDRFKLLEFEEHEIAGLFQDLHTGASEDIFVDEFIGGLHAMHGDAKSKDVIRILRCVTRLSRRFDRLVEKLETQPGVSLQLPNSKSDACAGLNAGTKFPGAQNTSQTPPQCPTSDDFQRVEIELQNHLEFIADGLKMHGAAYCLSQQFCSPSAFLKAPMLECDELRSMLLSNYERSAATARLRLAEAHEECMNGFEHLQQICEEATETEEDVALQDTTLGDSGASQKMSQSLPGASDLTKGISTKPQSKALSKKGLKSPKTKKSPAKKVAISPSPDDMSQEVGALSRGSQVPSLSVSE